MPVTATEYTVVYLTPTGTSLGIVVYSSLVYARRLNEIGTLTLTVLPIYEPGYFVKDGRIEIYRHPEGGVSALHLSTTWWITYVDYHNTEEGERVIEIQAVDNIGLLKRRIIAYDPDDAASYVEKTDYADDLMKDVVSENYGTGAVDASRDASDYMSIAPNLSSGQVVEMEIAWDNLLDVLTGVAAASWDNGDGIRIIFDIVTTPGVSPALEFKTWAEFRGYDHSSASGQTIVFSEDFGNLTNPKMIMDYNEELNYIYAIGDDTTQEASDTARIGLSPFARTEAMIDSQSDDAAVVLDEAKTFLTRARPKRKFEGRILDTPVTRYGVHYEYGDKLVAQYMGYSFDCVLESVQVTYNSEEGEKLELFLKGEATI